MLWSFSCLARASELWSADSAVDSAGNILLVGRFTGLFRAGDLQVQSAGGSDVLVAKFGNDGHPIWLRRFGGPSDDAGESIVVLPDGRIQITGSFRGALPLGEQMLVPVGARDLFLARLDAGGQPIWGRSFGTAGDPEDKVSEIAPQNGSLRVVMGGGGWATVYLNGEKLPSTAPLSLHVPAGQYEVRLENVYSGLDQLEVVRVDTGGTTVVSALFP